MSRAHPGFLVAGAAHGVGKTTVAAGLMAAFKRRGLRVQPFKAGSRPFDLGYHEIATGRPSLTLDLWTVPPDVVRAAVARRTADADLVVVDGTRGMLDGSALPGAPASSADLARALGLPIVLVLDASGLAESAAAIVRGFVRSGPPAPVGVLCNRVLNARHLEVLKRSIEAGGDAEFLGGLPRTRDFQLHPLNQEFVPQAHYAEAEPMLPGLVDVIEKAVSVDRLLEIARTAKLPDPTPAPADPPRRATIAVARDPAFPFAHELNLEALRAAGAELVFFSPMKDEALPSGAGGLYLPGGIPEITAGALERNQAMRAAVRGAAQAGMPIVAECGGLVYLATTLVGTGVRAWEMAAVIPGEIALADRSPSWGSVELVGTGSSFLVPAGERLRGYDLRAFSWSGEGTGAAWMANRPHSEARPEGFGSGHVHASFVHVNFAGFPALAERFAAAAQGRGGGVPAPSKKKKPRTLRKR